MPARRLAPDCYGWRKTTNGLSQGKDRRVEVVQLILLFVFGVIMIIVVRVSPASRAIYAPTVSGQSQEVGFSVALPCSCRSPCVWRTPCL